MIEASYLLGVNVAAFVFGVACVALGVVLIAGLIAILIIGRGEIDPGGEVYGCRLGNDAGPLSSRVARPGGGSPLSAGGSVSGRSTRATLTGLGPTSLRPSSCGSSGLTGVGTMIDLVVS